MVDGLLTILFDFDMLQHMLEVGGVLVFVYGNHILGWSKECLAAA